MVSREGEWQQVGRFFVPVVVDIPGETPRNTQFHTFGQMTLWSITCAKSLFGVSPFLMLFMFLSFDDAMDALLDLSFVAALDPDLAEYLQLWPPTHDSPLDLYPVPDTAAHRTLRYTLSQLNIAVSDPSAPPTQRSLLTHLFSCLLIPAPPMDPMPALH